MQESPLFEKVYGALIGSAIGDAMGGPVEMLSFEEIERKYGVVDELLPYLDKEPSAHGPWAREAGSYTDDTRIARIYCRAIIEKGDVPTDKNIARAFIKYYHSATGKFSKDFIEEYYLKAIYREDKQIFGGQPTNCGIMGITPFGVVNACNVQKAFDDAFRAMFIVEGYARYSAAIAAAAIAAAMKPEIQVADVINDSLNALRKHKARVEGKGWVNCHLYSEVGQKNEYLIKKGIEIAKKYKNSFEIKHELYNAVKQQFFADGSETLAIALTMFYAAAGDFKNTVIGAVNFGRDNDSSASVAGAIAGAYGGINAIPRKWVALVEKVNTTPKIKKLAEGVSEVIANNFKYQMDMLQHVQKLFKSDEGGEGSHII